MCSFLKIEEQAPVSVRCSANGNHQVKPPGRGLLSGFGFRPRGFLAYAEGLGFRFAVSEYTTKGSASAWQGPYKKQAVLNPKSLSNVQRRLLFHNPGQ